MEMVLKSEDKRDVGECAEIAAAFMRELSPIQRAEMIGFIRGARFAMEAFQGGEEVQEEGRGRQGRRAA